MRTIRTQYEFVRSPKTVLSRLVDSPNAWLIGLKQVALVAVLYEGAILLWAFGADAVTLPAFLRIPEDRYYFYELAFLIPLFFVTWLLAAAIAYLTSRSMGGSGSFDAILGGFGITMAVSAYFTLIPDYVQGILWTTGWVPFAEYQQRTGRGFLLVVVWAYMLAYVLAHILLYATTIRNTQGLGRMKSVLVAFLSFIGSFGVWIAFVR